jgi:SAM-dependent methyltransferase
MSLYERWSEYYDAIYKRINYEEECNTLIKIFKEKLGVAPKSILDVACGTGGHSIILAKQGYQVTGVDISEAMLKVAKAKARIEKVNVTYVAQDMRRIDLGRRFDCAICMFGAFPYNITYRDIEQTFNSVKTHLEDGGAFIFDFANIGGLRPTSNTYWENVEHEAGVLYRLSHNRFEAESNIFEFNFRFINLRRDGSYETFDETHRLRLFTFPEMCQYLVQNGFEVVQGYSWDQDRAELKPITRSNWRILVVSRKNSN